MQGVDYESERKRFVDIIGETEEPLAGPDSYSSRLTLAGSRHVAPHKHGSARGGVGSARPCGLSVCKRWGSGNFNTG
jgi:hypothetical protein